jgi:hypothetical protein
MLVYKDTQAGKRREPPAWLEGAADLQEANDRDGKARWWGIGNAHLVGERDDWQELDNGWRVAVAGPVDPRQFRRSIRWCRTVQVEDTHGRQWTAPVILNEHGDRCILVSYGKDFLPALNPAQARAVEIAKAARDALVAAQEVEEGGLDMSVAARWVAELLSLTHHIDMEVVAVLGLIDEALILEALAATVGLNLKKADS